RVVTTVGRHDALWMRVLDVPALLGSRRYLADESLVLRIDDRLGYVDGRYELDVEAGVGCIGTLDSQGDYDLACDVADLAAFCLGTLHPTTLHAAGRLHEGRAGAVRAASRMFLAERPIYCTTDF